MFKQIASNTLSQIISKFLTTLIAIFTISILTKYLSTEMYGQYNKIYNYLAFFAFFADLGLYTIAIREISKDRSQASKIIGNMMTLRLMMGVGVILIAVIIAFMLPGYNTPLMLYSIAIVSVFTLFSLLNSSVLSLMQAFMKIEFSLISSVIGKLVNLVGIFLIAYTFFPTTSTSHFDIAFLLILGAGALGIIVNFCLNAWYTSRIAKIRFLFDWKYIKYLFWISLPYGMALFLSVVYTKIDIILLSVMEPVEVADISIALYSLPLKITEVMMVLSGFFLGSLLPTLTHNFQKKNTKKLQELIGNSILFLLSLSLGLVIFVQLFGKDLLGLIATPEYIDHSIYAVNSVDVLSVVILVLLFYFLGSLFNYIFIATKKETILLKINAFLTGVNIVGNIIFIPIWSFMGAAYVTLFCQICLLILGYIYTKKIFSFTLPWKYIMGNGVLAGVIYMGGVYMIRTYNVGGVYAIIVLGGGLFVCYLIGNLILYKNIIKKALSKGDSLHQ